MYLVLPVKSATKEHTFSALRRLKNYLRSTMKQDRLNKLDTDALSQIDYGHSRHCEDWKEVCLCQLKTPKVFWKNNLSKGTIWLSGRSALWNK